MADIWEQLSSNDLVLSKVSFIWHELVPPYDKREPLTWHCALYLPLYFFMGYLVRRPHTHLIRVLLLPVVVYMTLRCTYGYKDDDPRKLASEWNRGLTCWFVIAKSLDFGLALRGRFKLEEEGRQQNRSRDETVRVKGEKVAEEPPSCNPAARLLPRSVFDALEVSLAMRGIGWDFGKDTQIPPITRPLERGAFVRATVSSVILLLLVNDLCNAILQRTLGMSPHGASMFFPDVPPIQRYASSTAIHLVVGLTILFGVAIVYDFASLFGVFVLRQSPAAWPPIFGNPLEAHSLHDFWGRTWHQAFRHTFLILGGLPGRRVAGSAGMVLGCFLASGLCHEFGMAAAGKKFDTRVLAFFLLQGLGILLEKTFKALSGKRVGGLFGFAWTALFVLGIGQMCTESWLNRGWAGRKTIPPIVSPAKRLWLPLAEFALRSLSLGGSTR
ncbi:membrane bound O-acyl transferase family-domain-containing protein [Trametes elegans]|nr:membrane bound O-acyl transferase family-domain-containing protein [Trametes elegans]